MMNTANKGKKLGVLLLKFWRTTSMTALTKFLSNYMQKKEGHTMKQLNGVKEEEID